MFNIVQRRKWFFIFSGIVIIAGLISMGISLSTYPEHWPVRPSIDFVGGSLVQLEFNPVPDKQVTGQITEQALTDVFNQLGLKDVRIQRLEAIGNQAQGGSTANTASSPNTSRWQVRTSYLSGDTSTQLDNALDKMAQPLGLQLNRDPNKSYSNNVSPTVGAEVERAAFIAVLAASIGVLLWIWWAFRGVQNAFRYSVCAVLAMLHDILVMAGIMSIMGLLFGWEADSLFLTGLLTVVGYSVQDTIVVFDRIRENAARHRGEPYEMIINRSIMETLHRSISMQLVVAFVLVSLFLIGGSSIRQFVGVLLIGLLSGTYSSTFVAIPLLVAWDEGQLPFVNRGAKRNVATSNA